MCEFSFQCRTLIAASWAGFLLIATPEHATAESASCRKAIAALMAMPEGRRQTAPDHKRQKALTASSSISRGLIFAGPLVFQA
jgi:hypothetical protein